MAKQKNQIDPNLHKEKIFFPKMDITNKEAKSHIIKNDNIVAENVLIAAQKDKNSAKNKNDAAVKKPNQNAFFKLDLDTMAIRMKKDLADRCCCADVPCVSIVKEYCESR